MAGVSATDCSRYRHARPSLSGSETLLGSNLLFVTLQFASMENAQNRMTSSGRTRNSGGRHGTGAAKLSQLANIR